MAGISYPYLEGDTYLTDHSSPPHVKGDKDDTNKWHFIMRDH